MLTLMSQINNKIKIKRIFTLLLMFTLTIVLVGCGKDSEKPSDTTPRVEDTTDYTPTRTVSETQVVVYEGPEVMESSEKVSIEVENQELFVYETLVNHGRVFTYTAPTTTAPVAIFDFEGSVKVQITVEEGTVENAVVRPLAYGVEPSISGNTISFTLEYSANYVIEYNNDPKTAVHLFANPLETDTPDPENLPDDMIYIGPGVYKADAIPVESNQTVYLAGGAVVYGQIRAEGVENVTIRGRGIIDGSIYTRNSAAEYVVPIEFRHSKNIKLEGITFLNPAGWTIASYFNDGLTIDNIKIMTARANGDGISLQSSKNVEVKNSFIRSWDDAIVVKNYDRGTTEKILFNNVVVWTDLAQSIEVGYETDGATMDDITFRNITVLHNFHKPVISIHNADDAAITNVVFQNITVEDAQMIGDNTTESYDNFLIDFFIQYNQEWSSTGGVRGTVDNVIVDNVKVIEGRDDLVSRITGFDANHKISNVRITNITIKGQKIKTAQDLRLSVNDFVSNVTVDFTAKESTGAALILPYNLELAATDTPQVTVKANIEQEGYLVPDFAIGELPQVYMGMKVTGDNFTATATHGNNILTWDDGTGAFEIAGNEATHALDGDFSSSWIGKEWTEGTSGDFAALTINFNENKKIGTIKLYGDPESSIYLLQNIAVFGVRSSSTSGVFTKILNADDYVFSPATGNAVEIKINPGEYSALQLRFYNRSGVAYPKQAFVSEVELYPASLTFNKAVIDATEHEDVYVVGNVTDGNPMTYFESKKGVFPAIIAIDMADIYDIKYINLYLPPLMQWETRTQNFAVLVSNDGINYTEVVADQGYTFNPRTGNIVEIELPEAVEAQYVKFVFSANNAPGGVGAQISEISIFE
jgi:F5/8 type C domain/Glycosyl hydrolases family 28